MRITHFFGATSKNAQHMRYDVEHPKGSIYVAYKQASHAKISAFEGIRHEYMYNDTIVLGVPCKTIIAPRNMHKLSDKMYIRYINGTLNVCGASSHFFSTVAIFEDVETGKRYIVKETHANTYMCEL